MNSTRKHVLLSLISLCAILGFASPGRADSVDDWNKKACDLLAPASFDTPNANRVLAMMHTAIYEAVNAITKKYPSSVHERIDAEPGASVDAAVAAAARGILAKLVASREAEIEALYQTALASIANAKARSDGIRVGEWAAAAILASRADEGFTTVETYRPYTVAGVYVPTVVPAVSQWPQRKPWLMTSAGQVRPAPPPDLKSELWARDYNEIKTIGSKNAPLRTVQQTDIARFWEATGPAIYHGIIRSVTGQPGREITRNARLFMAATQATDDAMIAVFDGKYHYNFWRPITAIRNGDIDGNDATERDPSWTPFINTPMHPEYPCAHCIVSGTIGTVIEAEIGNGKMPVLSTTSPTANNVSRSWTKIEDFMQEVANGRIYDGVHFRTSTEAGTAMGRQIGRLAATKYLRN